MQTLLHDAYGLTGEQIAQGEALADKISELDRTATRLRFRVEDALVWLELEAVPSFRTGCTCGRAKGGLCEHAAAALVHLHKSNRLSMQATDMARGAARKLMDDWDVKPATLRLFPVLDMRTHPPKLHLRMGAVGEKLTTLRGLHGLWRALAAGEAMPQGFDAHQPLTFELFDEDDRALLALLLELSELMPPPRAGGMPMPEQTLVRLFDLCRTRSFLLVHQGGKLPQSGISQRAVPLELTLLQAGGELEMQARHEDVTLLTQDGSYLLCEGHVYFVPPAKRRLLKPLYASRSGQRFRFTKEQAGWFVSDMLGTLVQSCKINIEGALAELLQARPLEASVYLDHQEGALVARAEFAYGERTLDPFAPGTQPMLLRDGAAEMRVLELLNRYGFLVKSQQAHLRDQEGMMAFFEEGLEKLQSICTVYLSEAFRAIAPRTPPVSIEIGVDSLGRIAVWLRSELEKLQFSDILPALREKKKYFRLKNGAFYRMPPELEALSQKLDLEQARAEDDALLLPATVLPYVEEFDFWHVQPGLIERLGAYRQDDETVPDGLEGNLYDYQKKGLSWLRRLHTLGLGGILADEMGLGKTVQVISLIQHLKNQTGRADVLIVAPTSLLYNWQAECARFAPALRVCVLEGSAAARRQTLEEEAEADVLILSYAQMRRDAAYLTRHYALLILDEAQQCKNASSVTAQAVRLIQASCRIALTGTPMENRPSELWAVFDAVLPGYLGKLSAFEKNYGEGGDVALLRKRIQPFLLRRRKAEVLSELPEKLETEVLLELTDEQRKTYDTVLLQLKQELLGQNMAREGMKMLAGLTRLRQICCDPALFLEGYTGGSVKLDYLRELVGEAVSQGHRLLVFSQFAQLLQTARPLIEGDGFKTLYLDGSVPALDRTKLMQAFNEGEGDVFLVSLKAGGTGLNLTGADTVVLFDPWWNPAVEQQAADRAHRVGQTRSVNVIRLLAHSTIEEQVFALCRHKQAQMDVYLQDSHLPHAVSMDDLRRLLESEMQRA